MSSHRAERPRPHPGYLVVAATVLALSAMLAPATTPAVRAAEEDFLRLGADATYRVVPADGEVRVRIDWVATNLQPNTVRRTPTGTLTTRYFFDRILFSVPDDARSVRAISGGTRLATTVRDRGRYREVVVRIPQLFYRQTRTMRVEFTLPGGKPRSPSDTRVGRAFTTFTAWAWGDAGRGTVRIVLPKGFDAEGYGSDVTQRTFPDRVELSSGRVDDATEWYRVVLADRPSALTHVAIEPGGRKVVIQAWPEDTVWRDRVSDVLGAGLPKLEEMVGLPWPLTGELEVSEVHTPLLEGYGGFFDPSNDTITMSEDLDDHTILHEGSHAWFNAELLTDRWIDEGLAEHYADRVREALDLSDDGDPVTVERTAKGNFPLDQWPAPGRIDDEATVAREIYGYAASYTVIRSIAEKVGDDGMRAVLDAADAKQNAYAGDGPPETTGARMDWKRFLDLVQEVGGMDDADDLFRRWVVAGSGGQLLATREEARAAYADLDAAGVEWAVPRGVRASMALWQFDEATTLMDAATPVLTLRDDLAAASADLGLTTPADLEDTFETALKAKDLAPVTDTLESRIDAAGGIADARDALAAERSPLVALGLVGETPDSGYEAARTAFRSGDTARATAGSAATIALLAGAESAGTTRAAIIGGVVLAGLLLLVLAVVLINRRRRRRALALGASGMDASTTLPATSEPSGTRPEVPSTPIETAPGAEPD